jgi:type I restriction enzyme S subunit
MALSDWREARLGDFVRLHRGVPYKGADLDKAGSWLLGLGAVRPGGGVKLGEARSYGGSAKDWQRIRPGELLIALTDITQDGRILGTPGLVPLAARGDFVVSLDLARVELARPELVDVRFLYYLLQSHPARAYMRGVATGTTIRRVSIADVLGYHALFPPLAEQYAIAHILGTLDDKIELSRRMSQTLEAMARALFKSWFIDFDPVRAKAQGRDPGLPQSIADLFPDRFETSELGEIPAGWGVRSLDAIARFVNGLALQRFPPTGGTSLPVIKIAQLRNGTTMGADATSADLDPDFVVADGDVLFSWSGSLECVVWRGGRGALNQHLFKVTSRTYPKWFYYFWLHAHLDDFRGIAADKTTTMGHIQRHYLSGAKVVVPPMDVIAALDPFVGPFLDSAWHRSAESRTLAALRDALLPKLISGEIRVPQAERILEAAPL